jgi:phosphate transport system substrate-binding protein
VLTGTDKESMVQGPRSIGSRLFWSFGLIGVLALAAGLSGAAQEATPVASRVPAPAVDLSQLSGTIIADGSSTVWPITAEAGERFTRMASNVIVDVVFSGTGGGFRRFCAGETDIQDASRPITDDERAACAAANVEYVVFPLGFDGITITVNPQNTWAQCLTVEQLKSLWSPQPTAHRWRDLDPAWPDVEIELYGPGPDSGTFDYFTEVIVGEPGLSRTDYTPSENDLDLVEGVASQRNALGYFGFAYYEADANRLRPLAVDSGAGCVLPTPVTIAEGSYAPLSRPLFIYVKRESLARPEVAEFVRFYLSQTADIVRVVGYVPLPASEYAENLEHFAARLANS